MPGLLRGTAIVAASLLLAGCFRKAGLLNQLGTYGAVPVSGVCGTVSDLQIIDARDSVSERALRVPTLSLPGRRDGVRPPLSDSVLSAVRGEVARRIGGGPHPILVVVRVTVGSEQVRTGALSEEESVAWAATVSLSGRYGRTSSSAEMSALVSSGDASAGFVDRMSAQVVRVIVARALEDAAGRLLPEARACRTAPAVLPQA